MDYSLNQSLGLASLALKTAYESLVLQGTGFIRVVNPPISALSSGVSGYNIAFSGNYFYACTGNNQWGRSQVFDFRPIYCNNAEFYCNNSIIYCNASGA